jgi:hypothetical protein
MRIERLTGPIAAGLILALQALPGDAQLGPARLPKDDFTWNWGNIERSRGLADISADGGEEGFQCKLEGKLSPATRMSQSDIRQLEQNLRASLFFIEASANAMNTLDFQRELDWATLDCDKMKPTEADAAKTQASLEKAKDKAVKKLIERREKREREEAKQQEKAAAVEE